MKLAGQNALPLHLQVMKLTLKVAKGFGQEHVSVFSADQKQAWPSDSWPISLYAIVGKDFKHTGNEYNRNPLIHPLRFNKC